MALLLYVCLIGGLLTAAWFSKSQTLAVEALHSMLDSLGVVLAIIAALTMRRSANEKASFGYQRAEVRVEQLFLKANIVRHLLPCNFLCSELFTVSSIYLSSVSSRQILAALFTVILLLFFAATMIYSAVKSLIQRPSEVTGLIVMYAALASIIINLSITTVLYPATEYAHIHNIFIPSVIVRKGSEDNRIVWRGGPFH